MYLPADGSFPPTTVALADLIQPGNGVASFAATGVRSLALNNLIGQLSPITGAVPAIAQKAQIKRDNMEVNSTNCTVCVGQQINLTNDTSGLQTSAATTYLWHISGYSTDSTKTTVFKDYNPTASDSGFVTLADSDLTNSHVSFYWSDGNPTRQVTCVTTSEGKSTTNSTTFLVTRPTGNLIVGSAGTVYADADFATNGISVTTPYIHFGKSKDNNYGMRFSGYCDPPHGFFGTNTWVQVINGVTLTKTSANSTNSWANTGGCDTTFPYPPIPTSHSGDAADSPGATLNNKDTSVSFNFPLRCI